MHFEGWISRQLLTLCIRISFRMSSLAYSSQGHLLHELGSALPQPPSPWQ